MSADSVWDVLRWVLAVLAAGFIGQFGRVLAMRLIERRRKRKARSDDECRGEVLSSSNRRLEQERLNARQKLEKKRIKAALKKDKKKAER